MLFVFLPLCALFNSVPRREPPRQYTSSYAVPKAVWKILKCRNFPSQHGASAGSLLENFYSTTSKEEVPLAYWKISFP
jgi:hypothetical protein